MKVANNPAVPNKSGSVQKLPSSMAQFSRFNDIDNISRTVSSIAALIDIKRSKQGLIDRNGNYTQ